MRTGVRVTNSGGRAPSAAAHRFRWACALLERRSGLHVLKPQFLIVADLIESLDPGIQIEPPVKITIRNDDADPALKIRWVKHAEHTRTLLHLKRHRERFRSG